MLTRLGLRLRIFLFFCLLAAGGAALAAGALWLGWSRAESVGSTVMDSAAHVAQETRRLRSESDRLTALLTEMPLATILLNPSLEIVLYDAQAADVLSRVAPPRLKAPLADYYDLAPLRAAMDRLSPESPEAAFELPDTTGETAHDARVKALGSDGFIVFIEVEGRDRPQPAPRPLVFDFDLMTSPKTQEISDTPLRDLCFVPFDTETTGLSVAQDAIVQIGAVRVLGGRIIEGEEIDTYVDPGRPIPPAATRIHKVGDHHVRGAPDIGAAGCALHHFARDSVLVAHNAPFDIGLLRRFAPEMGVEWPHPVVDTVLLSTVVFGTNEDHSLDALCARLDVTIPPDLRHTALGDARATAEALVKLLPLLEGKGIRTFGQLVQETGRHGRLLEDLNA